MHVWLQLCEQVLGIWWHIRILLAASIACYFANLLDTSYAHLRAILVGEIASLNHKAFDDPVER